MRKVFFALLVCGVLLWLSNEMISTKSTEFIQGSPSSTQNNNASSYLLQLPINIQQWITRSREIELAQAYTYGNHTYVLITRGNREKAGVELESLTQIDSGWRLKVRYINFSSKATTNPSLDYLFLVLPKLDGRWEFEREEGIPLPTLAGLEMLPPTVEQSNSIFISNIEQKEDHISVSGAARVFEAVLNYELVDENGEIIKEGFIETMAGAPNWGAFTLTLQNLPSARLLELRLFEQNMDDGKPIHTVSVKLN